MSKLRIVLIASVAGVVGIIAGAAGASWYWMDVGAEMYAKMAMASRSLQTQANIVDRAAVLYSLRAGQYDEAIKRLEVQMDVDLMTAGWLARDGSKFIPNVGRVVEREAAARKLSGYQPQDPRVREAVEEAFRLVPAAVAPERK
jgi:hypothetical protein